jgi:hypothetical protein
MTDLSKLLIARFVLHWITGDELKNLGDRLLDEGYYTPELAEMAMSTYPTLVDLAPMFQKASEKLSLDSMDRGEALRVVIRSYVQDTLAFGGFDSMLGLYWEVVQPEGLLGDPLLGPLNELFTKIPEFDLWPELVVDLRERESAARHAAKQWLEQNPDT